MDDGRSLRDGLSSFGSNPQAVSPVPASIPSAVRASAFIYAIADIFQAKHSGPLPRERAVSEAVAALEAWEGDMCFGDPRGDWSLTSASEAAEEAMQYWEVAREAL